MNMRRLLIILICLFYATVDAQQRPYIGFVYPAGGRVGTTFFVVIGGQYLDGVNDAYITGKGVKCKFVEYERHLSPQDVMLLREQLDDLKKIPTSENKLLISKIQKRIDNYVLRPASLVISNLAHFEVTIDEDTKPSEREIRVKTTNGYSNPLLFEIGQLLEVTIEPMGTTPATVLGKEADSKPKKIRKPIE